jgi:nucleotide-binding universal stress UspA family protein
MPSMPIRKIMVPVRGEARDVGVLEHALALARTTNAHIDVVHARPPASEFLSQSMMVTQSTRRSVQILAEQEADELERQARKLFEDFRDKRSLPIADGPTGRAQGVTIGWHERHGSYNTVIGVWGRLADVVAVAQPIRDRDPTHGHKTVEAALFHCGRPVLLCPATPSPEAIGRHIAVAWNGTAEGARLVGTALPLLRHAQAVSILQVKDGSAELDAAALAEYLTWWDVSAAIHEFPHRRHIGEELYTNAKAIGADVMLMGAYGHTRSREIILGGASSEVIEGTDLPVLLLK